MDYEAMILARQDVIDVVHHTIYEFFDVVEDDNESPMTYKDMKLLELNKSISTRIKNLPSVQRDTVKVVRCKDCKHHDGEKPGMVYCPDIIEGWISEYFFCAGGERREDGL